jgi:hypothetical protein
MEDGSMWDLFRLYEDFYDFQIDLLSAFPDEAGTTQGKARTLPFMPGPVWVVTDVITHGRQQNLDDYIKKLLGMPPHIAKCALVRRLFAPREKDLLVSSGPVPSDYRASGNHAAGPPQQLHQQPPRQFNEISRMSGGSMPSSGDSHGASPHNSSRNLNGSGTFNHNAGLSPPPARASQQQNPGGNPYYRDPSELYNPRLSQQQQPLQQQQQSQQGWQNKQGHQQAPSLSQPRHPNDPYNTTHPDYPNNSQQQLSQGSSSNIIQPPAPTASAASSDIKVKILLHPHHFKMAIPSHANALSFDQFRDRVKRKIEQDLKKDEFMMQWKDETRQYYLPLAAQEDLEMALEASRPSGKLTITVL